MGINQSETPEMLVVCLRSVFFPGTTVSACVSTRLGWLWHVRIELSTLLDWTFNLWLSGNPLKVTSMQHPQQSTRHALFYVCVRVLLLLLLLLMKRIATKSILCTTLHLSLLLNCVSDHWEATVHGVRELFYKRNN